MKPTNRREAPKGPPEPDVNAEKTRRERLEKEQEILNPESEPGSGGGKDEPQARH